MRNDSGSGETAPLLGSRPTSSNGKPSPSVTVTAQDQQSRISAAENGRAGADEADGEAVVTREGLPEVAAKMHLLIPAIGIGVSTDRLGLAYGLDVGGLTKSPLRRRYSSAPWTSSSRWPRTRG